MTRLRIVHLVDLAQVGGVETLYASFLQSTPPAGLQVEHVTLNEGSSIASRFHKPVYDNSHAVVSYKRFGALSLPRRPFALRAQNRLRLMRRFKPDLVVVWNQFIDFRHNDLGLDCPVVYYEHGMSWYTHNPAQLNGFFPHVNQGIAISRAGARMLQLKHRVQFPVSVCPNPVRPGLGMGERTPRTYDGHRPLQLGFAGRLVPLKSVALIILAAKELLDRGMEVEVAIAGVGPEAEGLTSLAKRLGVTDRVRFLGLLDDMAEFYRAIDIFVMTSMHDTMPLVCLEAMAEGVPVICPTIDGFPEIVTHETTGLCIAPRLSVTDYANLSAMSTAFAREVYDPVSDTLVETHLMMPSDIADAVEKMIAAPEVFRRFSTNALKATESGFQFNDWVTRLYDLFVLMAGAPLRSTKEA